MIHSTRMKSRAAVPGGGISAPLPTLFRGHELLRIIWPSPESRPSLRWLEAQAEAGRLPCIKIGKLRFFDATKVRVAIEQVETPATK